MENLILQKIETLEREIFLLKEEFEKWFLAYQKILDLILPEGEPEGDEMEAIKREEKLLKLEEI